MKQQHHQFLVQSEHLSHEHKTAVAPMVAQKRCVQFVQNSAHESGMFLFLADEKIDRRRVRGIAGLPGMALQLPPFATLTQLELLQ